MSAGVATIRIADLSLALMACKMRRANCGRTAQMCAMSEHPVVPVECSQHSGARRRNLIAARCQGLSNLRTQLMRRGWIAEVFRRTQLQHGRAEVLRTWGVGVRSLLAEPQHILNGGTR